MAHLTAIIDQITRMENSLVNILLETAVKLSTLTDANIFVMVESASGRKWAGRKSLRDEYVRGMLKPSSLDIEVTETVASMPPEEFSMGSLMGMASGGGSSSSSANRERVNSPVDIPAQPSPIYGAGPAVFPMAQQQPQSRDMIDPQPSAAKRPRISTSEPSSSMNLPSNNIHPSATAAAAAIAAAAAAKTLSLSNNNVASSPPQQRRKSPNRDQISQPVIMEGGRSSPKSTSASSRQETISKNLKDEFNGEEHPPDDAVVIKEELGRITSSRGGVGRGGGVGGGAGDGGGGGVGGVDDTFEDGDPDASVDGGPGSWGELVLAGPSGLQQNSDANQPDSMSGYQTIYRLTQDDLYLADQFLYGTLRSDHGCAVPYPYMASSSVHLFWRGWLYRYDKARRVHTRYRCTKRQGQQCCSGAISICSTPGNPLEVIREVPHNLDPEPDMERAVEKVKAARMKAIFRQQATGKQYVVYLETGKFDEYESPVKSEESMLALEGPGTDESIGSSVSPLSDSFSMV